MYKISSKNYNKTIMKEILVAKERHKDLFPITSADIIHENTSKKISFSCTGVFKQIHIYYNGLIKLRANQILFEDLKYNINYKTGFMTISNTRKKLTPSRITFGFEGDATDEQVGN